ncbi:hypothetical protein DFH06DRAFT_1225076 [Mycena polygramma]|nr:hypothetical protein DFH06DRAFT_1225076 [Mycena polygramma]
MLPGLQSDRSRIAHLRVDILRLETRLAASRAEMALAQERVDSYRYPVLTLPPELVSEIFIHFLPPYPGIPPLAGNLSPTLLTQICRRWRQIALGTPALWTAMGTINNVVAFPRELHAQLFRTWLKRSRVCPVALSIVDYCNSVEPELIAAVVPHRARWEYLELGGLRSILPLYLIQGPMPLLRHLDLALLDFPPNFAVLLDAPLLRTLILDDARSVLAIMVQWGQLTSLTLLRAFTDQCVPILQWTPNLVYCELHLDCRENNMEPPPTKITLPYLESLILVDYDGEVNGPYTSYFPDNLVARSLRRLEIPENFIWPRPVRVLTAFISRSGCDLQEVHITFRTLVSVNSYRKAFPSIGQLSFSSRYFWEPSDSDPPRVEEQEEEGEEE